MAKKTFVGKVTSDKMTKTVVVSVERLVRHPVYKKTLKKTSKIKADTNAMEIKTGMVVKIEQTRPISAQKSFKVIEIIEGGTK